MSRSESRCDAAGACGPLGLVHLGGICGGHVYFFVQVARSTGRDALRVAPFEPSGHTVPVFRENGC